MLAELIGQHLNRSGGAVAITDGLMSAKLAEDSKRYVQDVVNLALLAPDVLDRIAVGEQPEGLTTGYLLKTRFSAVWSEQRKRVAAF